MAYKNKQRGAAEAEAEAKAEAVAEESGAEGAEWLSVE